MKKRKILLTGAGAPGGPGIIKALQPFFDLVVSDCNPLASGRFLNESFVQLPKAGDENFIPFVFNFCFQNDIELIFPLVTKELFKFSLEKERFLANNIHILVSDHERLRIANDKGRLYQHLAAHGIVVPGFEIVRSVDHLRMAAKNLGYPHLPVCIKPTISNGSRGVRILQETIDEYDLLFNYKPDHLFTSLQKICEILYGKTFPELLVSEYLPGIEFSIDSIVTAGIPQLIIPRSRIKMNGGISVQGTFIQHKPIIDYCHQILRSLHLTGPIGLQVKEDKNGVFKLLEINPRIQGTSTAALGMGLNLPAIAVNQAFNPTNLKVPELQWGKSFIRYYQELFY